MLRYTHIAIAIALMTTFSLMLGCSDDMTEADDGSPSDMDTDNDTDTGSDTIVDADADTDIDSGTGEISTDSQIDGDTETLVVDPALRGPASSLYIDASVHTGLTWGGENYEGVWGEPFQFLMSDYPLSWAVSLVHASMLYKSRGMDFNPNTLLALAIRQSRLECDDSASTTYTSGCFQIEPNSAFIELRRLFPSRFVASYEELISGNHFETSVLATFFYHLFNINMFRMYTKDPFTFFTNHPDSDAAMKTLHSAYKEGPWWTGFEGVFSNCEEMDVLECFEDNAVIIDYSVSIINYTSGLDGADVFDAEITVTDLEYYWSRIDSMYPEVNYYDGVEILYKAFTRVANERSTISFGKDLEDVLSQLIAFLPPVENHEETTRAACQFYGSNMMPGVCID